MLSASFWTSTAAQYVIAIVFGIVAGLIGWFVLGSALRAKKDRDVEQRMRAVMNPAAQPVGAARGELDGMDLQGSRPGSASGSRSRGGSPSGWMPSSRRPGCRFGPASSSWSPWSPRSCSASWAPRSCGTSSWRWSLAGVGVFIPTIALRTALQRREEKLRDQLPDVLTILASSLRAGHSFLQSLDTVAKEIAPPAASEFQRVVAEIRLGRPAEDALEALAERVGSADFKWAVLAVNIQREVGGNLAEILDNVSDTLRERATLRRQIRVLTAEGRLSAWVLALLPVAIGLYMAAVNSDYISLLVTTTVGWVMLGTALVLLVLGVIWMRKIVDIDV